MHTQNTKIHSQIALAIKSSKRLMFKRHREGMDLRTAADLFVKDADSRLEALLGPAGPPVSTDDFLDYGTVSKVGGAGKHHELAVTIMGLLKNPNTPDELQDALLTFLCDADEGDIAARYTELPGGLQALEHLLTFIEWKEAHKEVADASN